MVFCYYYFFPESFNCNPDISVGVGGNLAGRILLQDQFTLPIFENTGLDAFVKLWKHQFGVF